MWLIQSATRLLEAHGRPQKMCKSNGQTYEDVPKRGNMKVRMRLECNLFPMSAASLEVSKFSARANPITANTLHCMLQRARQASSPKNAKSPLKLVKFPLYKNRTNSLETNGVSR